ncbi:histidine phosphatase family protein [Sporosarcina sp. 179-K 3D1 HS]|uniref:histidine phosphatase family protein n=1 Tax=Sporosarcina sp. 179-K 3D1 HS TaxID=3232169 RepID=UPI0039A35C7B
MVRRYRIHLIRHLPTAGNQARQYIGWTDEPVVVNEGRITEPLNPSVVYGSDLLRAKQTAELYFPEAAYEADARWRECNFGVFEGKTYAELEKVQEYRDWIDNPFLMAPEDGESLRDVQKRVLEALAELPDEAVVVTHGGPMRVILTKFSPIPQEFWSWNIPHGVVYQLDWDSEQAFKEGKPCMSISAELQTENGIM